MDAGAKIALDFSSGKLLTSGGPALKKVPPGGLPSIQGDYAFLATSSTVPGHPLAKNPKPVGSKGQG